MPLFARKRFTRSLGLGLQRWFAGAGSVRQCAVAGVFVAVLLSAALVRQSNAPRLLRDDLPPQGPRAAGLADRLDPNTATAAELTAIPGVGPGRAAAIVAYREASGRTPTFVRAEDLEAVRGIGPVVRENVSQHMVFPGP